MENQQKVFSVYVYDRWAPKSPVIYIYDIYMELFQSFFHGRKFTGNWSYSPYICGVITLHTTGRGPPCTFCIGNLFKRILGATKFETCPSFSCLSWWATRLPFTPGKMFPVKTLFLEDALDWYWWMRFRVPWKSLATHPNAATIMKSSRSIWI